MIVRNRISAAENRDWRVYASVFMTPGQARGEIFDLVDATRGVGVLD